MYKEGFLKIQASKSRMCVVFLASFLVGVGGASIADVRLDRTWIFGWLAFVVVVGSAIWWFRRWLPWAWTFGIVVGLAVGVGVLRYALVFPSTTPDYVHFYAPGRATISGIVDREPDVRTDGVRYVAAAQTIATASSGARTIRGRVHITYDLYPRWRYGEAVQVECTLQLPQPITDTAGLGARTFRYDLYLARVGVFAICAYPRVEKIAGGRAGMGRGNQVFAQVLRVKNFLAERITALWPEPEASFMAGLLYGYRGGLGSLNEAFSRTGVTHIVAISGFNIAIIATILINFFIYCTVPRPHAFWWVCAGIAAFVVFTGASASVVRAGIMGGLALFAKYLGRPTQVGRVLLFAAALMVVHNPLVLAYDAGFQLSFLSTLGLVYLAPVLKKYAGKVPEFFCLRENLVSTMAAIFATLPLVLYQFGRLSLVAPLVNILILWIIPWLMLAGTAAVVASFVWWPLGQVVAWSGWVGMKYVITIVRWFAAQPFASISWQLPAWVMVGLYCGMIYGVYYARPYEEKSNRPKFNPRL